MPLESFIESAILGLLSLITLILFISAFRKIFSDEIRFFDRIDKSIIILAGIQILFLTIFFLIHSSEYFLVIIRLARLFQEAILWMILSFLIFDESKYDVIYKVMMVLSGLISIFGMVSLFQLLFLEENNLETNFVVFSSFTLFINIVSICFGLKVLYIIQDYFQKELNEYNPDDSDFSEGGRNHLKFLTSQEMKNRKMQIYTLVSVHFVSAALQFAWDLVAYEFSEEGNEEYRRFFYPEDIFTLAIFIILKLVCNFSPVWIIYFVFYWRNRTTFNEMVATERNSMLLVEFKRDSKKEEEEY